MTETEKRIERRIQEKNLFIAELSFWIYENRFALQVAEIQGMCAHHDVKVNIYAPNAPLRFDGFEFTQDAIGEMLIQGYDESKAKLSSEK